MLSLQGECFAESEDEARSVGEAVLDGSSDQTLQGECFAESEDEVRTVGEAVQKEYRILEPLPDDFAINYNEAD